MEECISTSMKTTACLDSLGNFLNSELVAENLQSTTRGMLKPGSVQIFDISLCLGLYTF